MVYKYVSIKNVIARLYRDFGLEREFPLGDLVEWIADCVDKVGSFNQTYLRVAKVTIKDHRGKLPCNFHKLNQIAFEGEPVYKTMSSFLVESGEQDTTALEHFGIDVTQENFPLLMDSSASMRHEYEINDNCIFTDFINGDIFISYEAIPTDKEGFILIPDNEYLRNACVEYCFAKYARMCWIRAVDFQESNKWKQIFDDTRFRAERLIFAARGDMNLPDKGQMENLKIVNVRLVPNMSTFKDYFNSISYEEVQWN